ncbi:MAG TPA: hypothetical protein VNQ90_06180 [Chthoniobacteraceae bacterium]|nr:hypothetical protein [Chthoniobacteraceae bacterium]
MAESSPTASKTSPPPFELETPWTIEQVQGHLILGPIARHVKVSTLAIIVIVSSMVIDWATSQASLPRFALDQLFSLLFLGAVLHSHKVQTRQQQAIILWGAIKGTAGFACFVLITAGTMTQWFDEGNPLGALLCLILGLTWMPGPEFIPRLVPHQKAITAGRIVITLLCLAVSLQQGFWTS